MDSRRQLRDEAFTAFVSESWETLSRLAGNRSGGEDLLQDALLRTYAKWDAVEPGKARAFTRRVLTDATGTPTPTATPSVAPSSPTATPRAPVPGTARGRR